MAEAKPTLEKPVVEQVKMPKMKVDGSKIAYVNAFATAGALFFGVATIFSAIAGFTNGKWIFGIPFDGLVREFSIGMYAKFFWGILTLALALLSFFTVSKITDASAISKAWNCIAKISLVVLVLFGIEMLCMILTSLIGLGKKSGVVQKDLWLSGFLPTAIMAATTCGIMFIAKAIAAGKTQLLRVMTLVALGVGSVACVLVFISEIVGMYGKKSAYDEYDDLLDEYDSYLNLFK